jgi:hypothetical protein
LENLKVKDYFGELGVDRRMKLKWILWKKHTRIWTESPGLG